MKAVWKERGKYSTHGPLGHRLELAPGIFADTWWQPLRKQDRILSRMEKPEGHWRVSIFGKRTDPHSAVEADARTYAEGLLREIVATAVDALS